MFACTYGVSIMVKPSLLFTISNPFTDAFPIVVNTDINLAFVLIETQPIEQTLSSIIEP